MGAVKKFILHKGQKLSLGSCGVCKYGDDPIGEERSRCNRCLAGRKPAFTLASKFAEAKQGEEERNEEDYDERMSK